MSSAGATRSHHGRCRNLRRGTAGAATRSLAVCAPADRVPPAARCGPAPRACSRHKTKAHGLVCRLRTSSTRRGEGGLDGASLRPAEPIRRAARQQDERARWSAVVPLALEKRLFLNASYRCPLMPLLGKKSCDINERLSSF